MFHPSPWSLHYYGQWLIYNDCAFRWRHYYDYLLFVDRDEFLHFAGKKPHQVRSGHHWQFCLGIFVHSTSVQVVMLLRHALQTKDALYMG